MAAHLLKEKEDQGQLIQLVSFCMEKEEYAVDILNVQEILRIREMTRVPKAPSFIKGVINLRGKIVPVIDLRIRLGMAPVPTTQRSRIVVVNHAGKNVGMIVDLMSEVLRVSKSFFQPVPATSNGQASSEHIQSVAKLKDRLLILLNLESLLADTQY